MAETEATPSHKVGDLVQPNIWGGAVTIKLTEPVGDPNAGLWKATSPDGEEIYANMTFNAECFL